MTPLVLAFETSCDETAVAVVKGREVLSSILSSQVDLHARFGGVVPEVAARAHVEAIRPLTHRALVESGVHPADLDAVAATAGPGLVGALLVGHSFAKATAFARQLPFIGVDHMEGHLMAPRIEFDTFQPPAVVLLASGGHSQIIHARDWGEYQLMGETIDDAAGEAFDKLARLLGLGFPGGPEIDRAAEGGDPRAVSFPRAIPDRPYHVSFSGLKTSVSTYLRKTRRSGELPPLADVAASVQEAIVDALVDKTMRAVDDTGVKVLGAGGGVLANRRLRARLEEEAASRGVTLCLPAPALCTDNAAMIGVAAGHWLEKGHISDWAAPVDPGRRL
ncbi:MAG TPA: tRNA (adenosine(37)-N6)-threonylcarbamoyltransferase complex transferase subunit TsaD [Acidimicrobiia bacterium]|nr:tRNA (adenosine(37)-N6)-threonylcarbamoyltransferase complex transferase subunit TsaD [Acidimicrobiia bacterium]